MARRRPSAFEVSFPEEAKRQEALQKKREQDERERKRLEAIIAAQQVDQKKLKRREQERLKQQEREERRGTRAGGKKRPLEVDDADMEESRPRPAKKPQIHLPTEYYNSRPDEVRETADTFLEGEDELFSDSGEESDDESNIRQGSRPALRAKPKQKPIRLLTDFTIFDSRHRNEFILLSKVEEEDGVDRKFEVAGWVVPYYIDEEDLVGEDGEEGGAGDEVEPLYMRIGPVLRYSIDWTKDKDPIYIETQHAWYILKMPAGNYTPWYQEFYIPRRITQLVISSAIKRLHMGLDPFIHGILTTSLDIFGNRLDEDDLWNAAEIIRDAVDEVETEQPDTRIRRVPAISHIIQRANPRTPSHPRPSSHRSSYLCNHLRGPRLRTHHPLIVGLRNPDIAVLKAENQNPTHVTPLIASIAKGFVNEDLVVVGPPPKKVDEVAQEQQRRKALGTLWRLIERAKGGMLDVDWRKEDRVNPRSNYLRKVLVGGKVYQPGDFVIVPRGKYEGRDPPEWPKEARHLPSTATIATYFWFARIMYIKNEEQIAHVLWLEHSSQTMLQELANPQELFFYNLCNPVPLGGLIAKMKVHLNPAASMKPDDYFVRFIHDKGLATYISLDEDYQRHLDHYAAPGSHINGAPPLDHCPSCVIMEEDIQRMQWQFESRRPKSKDKGKERPNETLGIIFNGKAYHVFDFILYRAEKGPSHIGQIIDMQAPPRSTSRTSMNLKVKKVGRIWDLVGKVVDPEEAIKDERHVFLTDEEDKIPYTDIMAKCFVFSHESFGQRISLRKWLGASPFHFYLRYRFPNLRPESWDERVRVSFRDLSICGDCTEEALKMYYEAQDFNDKMQEKPLQAVDLFGGVGAFSLGLKEGSGCLQVSHALEISPSAAKTIKRNCAGTKVINQCVNVVLRYAIKQQEGHHVEPPLQLWDGKTPIPNVPPPGSVDVIIAGFPCQTHSGLNMFKTANDVKSNLMLTALSWVDFYRPKYAYMENVTGFLNYRLNTQQATINRVEGGITMGGLKLLVRTLLEMGYQVRYSLLHAGHYGTPQRRVRFFLIAAQSGLPLPELPQPTHDFPQVLQMLIRMPNGDIVKTIRPGPGTAPHPFISIEDAIGDLPRFDWKRPGPQRRDNSSASGVPALVCEHKQSYCGYKGRVEYHCEPRTVYQKAAREKESTDLQHFTKTVKARKVDRVLAIPMNPGADYRSLRADMHEWQFANPISSAVRQNFRPGWYGRLDKDNYFPTIVTNIDPMAKQCRVLHPYCKRMVTVRELARAQGFPDWFVFEAYKNNVVIMHRQIGNAVPLPLGRALGREFREVLFKEWKEGRLEGREGGPLGEHVVQQQVDEDVEMREVGEDSDVDSNEGLYV